MLKLTQIKEVSLNKEDSIKKAMQLLDKSKFGFFIVKDKKNRLLGTVTDGDIRREMVTNGSNSNSNASKIMNGKPITSDDDYTVWKEIFLNNDIEHLPILDKDKNVIKIVRNVENQNKLSFNDSFALIIAGGLGTRMGENYKNQPKCLIEIKGKTSLS